MLRRGTFLCLKEKYPKEANQREAFAKPPLSGLSLLKDEREHLKLAQQFPGRNGKCRSVRMNNRAAPATRGDRFAEDKYPVCFYPLNHFFC